MAAADAKPAEPVDLIESRTEKQDMLQLLVPTQEEAAAPAILPSGIRSRWQGGPTVAQESTGEKNTAPAKTTSDEAKAKKKRWKMIILSSIFIVMLPILGLLKDIMLMTIGTVALYQQNEAIARVIADLNFRNNPKCVGVLISWGNIVSAKNPAAAMHYYEEAVRTAPKHASSYLNRGRNWLLLGNQEKGLADYNQALTLKPDYALAYNNRSVYYRSHSQWDKALDDANKALKFNGTPENPLRDFFWYQRGLVYIGRGEWQAAVDDMTTAIAHGYTGKDVYQQRALALIKLNEIDRAQADYEHIHDTQGINYIKRLRESDESARHLNQ